MENKQTVYLTLDLEQDYGTALDEENYYALKNFRKLFSFLKKYNIPLTIFIQTKILDEAKVRDTLPTVDDAGFHASYELCNEGV